MDYELKREYQRFLQERNRASGDESGKPDRTPAEVRAWAEDHVCLSSRTGGRSQMCGSITSTRTVGRDHEDFELATGHHNSRQMVAKQASGFQIHRSRAGQLRGARAGRGGSPFDPHAAERVIRYGGRAHRQRHGPRLHQAAGGRPDDRPAARRRERVTPVLRLCRHGEWAGGQQFLRGLTARRDATA
jgi:hypothetical protein